MSGATHFRMKSTSPDSIQHSRTSGSARTNSSNARRSASAWLDRCTDANTVTSKPSLRGSSRPAIAADVARLFQGAHPAQAGRRRDADPSGQFHIGDSAVGLDLGQDFQVDVVEILAHMPSFELV